MSINERRNRPASIDVLIVDDEDDIRELLELSLLRMGLGCDAAGSVAEARACLERQRYRLCLTDMRLPDGDGFELVEYIQQHLPGLPVAVITAFGSIDTAIRALKLGAFDFVTKPIELKVLRELVSHALKLEPRADAAAPGGRWLSRRRWRRPRRCAAMCSPAFPGRWWAISGSARHRCRWRRWSAATG